MTDTEAWEYWESISEEQKSRLFDDSLETFKDWLLYSETTPNMNIQD